MSVAGSLTANVLSRIARASVGRPSLTEGAEGCAELAGIAARVGVAAAASGFSITRKGCSRDGDERPRSLRAYVIKHAVVYSTHSAAHCKRKRTCLLDNFWIRRVQYVSVLFKPL